jgi:hypothetical protein
MLDGHHIKLSIQNKNPHGLQILLFKQSPLYLLSLKTNLTTGKLFLHVLPSQSNFFFKTISPYLARKI